MTATHRHFLRRHALAAAAGMILAAMTTQAAQAAKASAIAADARAALASLYAQQPKAAELGKRAKAILVFPAIYKAGFMLGGQTGDGALLQDGKVIAYYNISAASFGLQLGAQKFSNALFFMNDKALAYLEASDGWAVGTGPSIVVIDKGVAGGMNSTTLTQDVYAVPFGQNGLMAGLGMEGSKITRIHMRK